jgi:hypothetical protein
VVFGARALRNRGPRETCLPVRNAWARHMSIPRHRIWTTQHGNHLFPASDSESQVKTSNSSRVSAPSHLVLARMEATPPQRLIDHIEWTPSCSSRKRQPNQISQPPLQAITPSRPSLASDHLQTADQSTYPLPIPLHITMSPAVTLCISPGSSLSGSGQFSFTPADLDRRYTLDSVNDTHPFPSLSLYSAIGTRVGSHVGESASSGSSTTASYCCRFCCSAYELRLP